MRVLYHASLIQIELLEGWNGPIITNETLFIVLDGMAVYGAAVIFHFVHPGKFMPHATATGNDELDDAKLPVYSNGRDEYGDSMEMNTTNANGFSRSV